MSAPCGTPDVLSVSELSLNFGLSRLLVPVVVLDTSVTTADIVGSQIFGVLPIFETEKCLAIKKYLVAYIALRLVRYVAS